MFSVTATTSHTGADFVMMESVRRIVARHNNMTMRLAQVMQSLPAPQMQLTIRETAALVREFNRTADELFGEVMHADDAHDQALIEYIHSMTARRAADFRKYETLAVRHVPGYHKQTIA